ncbi:unnamed protein product [Amoebophrya sp. A25]|nr:unnamed protein product [Amoebophrya sp. A25]|eukprot:GSA25T00023151001.1
MPSGKGGTRTTRKGAKDGSDDEDQDFAPEAGYVDKNGNSSGLLMLEILGILIVLVVIGVLLSGFFTKDKLASCPARKDAPCAHLEPIGKVTCDIPEIETATSNNDGYKQANSCSNGAEGVYFRCGEGGQPDACGKDLQDMKLVEDTLEDPDSPAAKAEVEKEHEQARKAQKELGVDPKAKDDKKDGKPEAGSTENPTEEQEKKKEPEKKKEEKKEKEPEAAAPKKDSKKAHKETKKTSS